MKGIGFFFTFFLAFSVHATNWQITGIQAAPERVISTASNMAWELQLTREDGERTVVSTTTFELTPILDHFQISVPADLVGRSFGSDRQAAVEAFDLLRVMALHDGRYSPPDADAIIDQAAEALSHLHLPTFADVDFVTVQKRFDEVFVRSSVAVAWGQELAARVANRSRGTVQVVPIEPRALESSIAGKGLHFVAIRGKERMYFGVTTGRLPFVELRRRS